MSTMRFLVTLLALAAVACAPRNPFKDRPLVPAAESSVLLVTNNNWATAVVYAVTDGQTLRLGSVETGMSATLRLPAAITASGRVNLRVYTLAASDFYESGPIFLAPGETVELVVENMILLSNYYVYQ
jgi:hypothetical protein